MKTMMKALGLSALLLAGCGDEGSGGGTGSGKAAPFFSLSPSARTGAAHGSAAPAAPGAPGGAPCAPGAAGTAAASASSALAALPPQEFTEADFTETDKSRDPFKGVHQGGAVV